MEKLRKGDEVIVIAGRDKGKRGVVARRVDSQRLVVAGVNVVKRHVRPNPMKGVAGGVIDKEMPIDQSNLMVWNVAAAKGDRIGFEVRGGKKVRVFKSNGQPVGR